MAQKNRVGFMQLTIIGAFGLFYAWYLIMFFGVFLFPPESIGFTENHIGQAIVYIGDFVGAGVILLYFQKHGATDISGSAGALFWVLDLFGLALPLCIIVSGLGIALPRSVFYAACALTGLSLSVGFMSWDSVSKRSKLKRSTAMHAAVFCTGGVIFILAMLALSPLALGVLSVILPIASLFFLRFIGHRSEPTVDRSVSDAREFFKKTRHLDWLTMVLDMAFGFAFILLYKLAGMYILLPMLIALIADALLIVLIGRNNLLPFVGSIRIAIILVVIGLLGTCSSYVPLDAVSLGLIVITWFLYRTINGGSLTELAATRKISLHYTAVRGKQSSNLGFLLGLCAGLLILSSEAFAKYTPEAATVLIGLIVISALILLPFENEIDTPGIRTLAPVAHTEDSIALGMSTGEKCRRLAALYKLSPRESDVLEIVATGRNAKYAAEQLFISESTAKTHIAGIYRKTDVHSQQQLFDLLDQMERLDADGA